MVQVSAKKSFEGFDWKTFMLGFKKPAIMLLTAGIGILSAYPEVASIFAVLGGTGVVVERLWAIIEFYVKEVKL